MAGIVKGAAGLVGNTPLLEPVNLEKKEGLKARIFEYVLPRFIIDAIDVPSLRPLQTNRQSSA